jgi:hypothetical protein
MLRLMQGLLIAVLLSTPALAQGGGFVAGDEFLYSPAITDISSTGGALVQIDLAGGTDAILVDVVLTFASPGAMAFDPYRQRVIFFATVAPSTPFRLWATDSAGALTDLGLVSGSYHAFAPTGDGRIYMHDTTPLGNTHPFVYLDAAGTLNTLLDSTGTVPFLIDGLGNFDVREMLWDAGTNALFVASNTTGACQGGASDKVNIHKLPLSADGTRVVGPVGCAQFEVSSSGETPTGLSRGPAGSLLLVVDTNSNNQEPRMVLVDPVTLAMSAFASNGSYTGAAATNAGTWSSTLNKAVILDTFTDELREYAAGETGNGTVLLPTGVPVSAGGSSGETATLIEVPASSCKGGWIAYGTGLAGKGGFVPRLYGTGCPNIGGSFTLTLDHMVGSANATLFIGLSKTSVPFKGGSFFVGNVLLSLGLGLGGPPAVAGAGALTLPAALPNDPLLQGVSVFLQAGSQDAAAVKGVSLTQGLELEIG